MFGQPGFAAPGARRLRQQFVQRGQVGVQPGQRVALAGVQGLALLALAGQLLQRGFGLLGDFARLLGFGFGLRQRFTRQAQRLAVFAAQAARLVVQALAALGLAAQCVSACCACWRARSR